MLVKQNCINLRNSHGQSPLEDRIKSRKKEGHCPTFYTEQPSIGNIVSKLVRAYLQRQQNPTNG